MKKKIFFQVTIVAFLVLPLINKNDFLLAQTAISDSSKKVSGFLMRISLLRYLCVSISQLTLEQNQRKIFES